MYDFLYNNKVKPGYWNEPYYFDGEHNRLKKELKEIFNNVELVVKVKEPQNEELDYCSSDLTMFTYFHFAASEELTKSYLKTGATAIAYETIITDFASGNLKGIKYLLDKKVFDQFNVALEERENKEHKSETTFVGINSASIKEHNKINNILEVTVDYVSEIISCIKDKDNKILSGDPEKVKKVFDTWKFSKDPRSNNPNWLLIDTQI